MTKIRLAAAVAVLALLALAGCKDTKGSGGSSAPQPSDTCGGYSWCTSQSAPSPVIDAAPDKNPVPTELPGVNPPVPTAPYHCATKTDPEDTGIYIDPIDDEIVGTAISSCLTQQPRKFTLVLQLFYKGRGSGVWVPVPGGTTTDRRPPYLYPAFSTTHAVAECTEGSYYMRVDIPLGSIASDGTPMPEYSSNGRQFDTQGNCRTH